MRYALLLLSFRLLAQPETSYITLTSAPTPSQQAALEKLLEEQQNPSSPNYHHWLTPEEFGDRLGLNRGDYAKVVAWVESQGLHVESLARARNWVAFSGPADQVRRAFPTDLAVPKELDKLVSGVRRLETPSKK